MANLTLAIDAQLLKEARTVAFERETTLTELIREYLRGLSKGLAIKRLMAARQLIKGMEKCQALLSSPRATRSGARS